MKKKSPMQNGMRILLCITTLLMLTINSMAQKDVTTFLGIPIDGSKDTIIHLLEQKGFWQDKEHGLLRGVLSGHDVNLYIGTKNGKVWRMMITDADKYDETEIKRRFNKLCAHFMQNTMYYYDTDFTLAENEDISRGIIEKGKLYKALFYQKPAGTDSLEYKKELDNELARWFTHEQLINPDAETAEEIRQKTEKWKKERDRKKCVWFIIHDNYGEFCIYLFYDNRYNYTPSDLF